MRFRAYGERQTVFLHERRNCNCRHGCGGGWSERTARVELRKIVARVEAGVWEKPTRREAVRRIAPAEIPLFDDYIEYWLTERFNGVLGEKPLDANTRRDYRWRAGHLKRFFGRYRLDEIDGYLCLEFKAHKLRETQELREALQAGADLRDARNRRVVPLGAASLKKLLTTLTAVLGDAIEDGHLDANPARSRRLHIRVPKPKRTSSRSTSWPASRTSREGRTRRSPSSGRQQWRHPQARRGPRWHWPSLRARARQLSSGSWGWRRAASATT